METAILDVYIGGKIKEFRNKKGLTQKELGKIIGVGHTTVSAYEKGTITLNMNTLFAIGEALDIKVDDLFPDRKTEEPYLQRTKDMYSKNLDAKDLNFLQQLMEKTAAMNEDERKRFLDSLEFAMAYHDNMKNNN